MIWVRSFAIFAVCFLSVFSLLSVIFLCVFSLCFLSVSFSVFSVCVFSLCFLSLCVICLCFLSGFAFSRTTKNDRFRSINVETRGVLVSYQASPFNCATNNDTCRSVDVDVMLLWSGIAGQLLFTKSCC